MLKCFDKYCNICSNENSQQLSSDLEPKYTKSSPAKETGTTIHNNGMGQTNNKLSVFVLSKTIIDLCYTQTMAKAGEEELGNPDTLLKTKKTHFLQNSDIFCKQKLEKLKDCPGQCFKS